MRYLIFFLLVSYSVNSQITTKDNIQIKIKKSKLVNNRSIVGIRQLKVKSNKLKKVLIKTKIKSKSNEKTKLSAFSLIDNKNKIRYRLADYKGYTGIIGYPELIPFRKSVIYNKKGKLINYGPPINKSEKDYFNKFDIEGYKNLEIPVNFGTKKNPILSLLYFGETQYKNFTAELYFTILVEYKGSDYSLYYKDEKISDVNF
jgi:hypothetical protein